MFLDKPNYAFKGKDSGEFNEALIVDLIFMIDEGTVKVDTNERNIMFLDHGTVGTFKRIYVHYTRNIHNRN